MRIAHCLMAAMLGLLLAAGGVHAQQRYPTNPIRLIVPFPPGGGADIVARLVAQKLTESFGVTVVVDNRPGAAGMIGTEAAANAPRDGHTLLLISVAYAFNASIYKLPYDPATAFAPVASLGTGPVVLAVTAKLPVNSLQELLALMGLGDVLLGAASELQPGGQAEEREQAGGVQEEADPVDPAG